MANWFNPGKDGAPSSITITDAATVKFSEAIAYDVDENKFGIQGYCTAFTACEEMGNKYFTFEPQLITIQVFKKDFQTEWMDKAKGEKKVSEKKQTPAMKLLSHFIGDGKSIEFGDPFKLEFECAVAELTAEWIITGKKGDAELSPEMIDLLKGGNIDIQPWDVFDEAGNPVLEHLKGFKPPEAKAGGKGYASKNEGQKMQERMSWLLADLEKGEESLMVKVATKLNDLDAKLKNTIQALIEK